MYYLIGPAQIIETVLALSETRVDAAQVSDLNVLRRNYVAYLESTQPGLPLDMDYTFAVTSFSEGDCDLREAFGYELSLPGWDGADPAWDAKALRRAHKQLGKVSAELQQILELVTLRVYSPSSPERPGSGTLYQGNGLMYVNPLPTWTTGDICEAYLHELTHILLTLDEYRHGHYASYEMMAQVDRYVPTAILQRQQPLHLAFHSAVVAIEVLALRRDLAQWGFPSDLHRPSETLVITTRDSLAAIRELVTKQPSLMRPRGIALLDAAEQRLAGLDPATLPVVL